MSDKKPVTAGSSLPLFYRVPEALTHERHGALRLREGGYGFAVETNAAPIAATEFASVSRDYPIVFSEADAGPVAVLGLQRENLFVDGEGQWVEDAYVPAYVRRYPFVLADTGDGSFLLAIDSACERLSRDDEEGTLLFDGDQPSDLVKRALQFCGEFQGAHRATMAFATALRERDLLVDRHANVQLPNGRPLQLAGFQVVDAERFNALDEETVVAWHRSGWLSLVHLHLASLERFVRLLARQAAREPAAAA